MQSLTFRLSPSQGPLRLWPLLSPHRSDLLPRSCCRICFFFAVTSPSGALHHWLVDSPSPLKIYILRLCLYLHHSSLSADFCLLFGARSHRPPSSFLLSPAFASSISLSFAVASVSGVRSCWSSFFRRLLWWINLTGIHCWLIALPSPLYQQTRTPFQRVYLEFLSRISDFRRYKDVASRSLLRVISSISSPGLALRGTGLGGSPTPSSSCLSFPVASLRIDFLIYIPIGIIQLLLSLLLLISFSLASISGVSSLCSSSSYHGLFLIHPLSRGWSCLHS